MFVFVLGCLCKCTCIRNKLRLAAILFLCRANLPRIWPHFHTQVPSLQHTNWHVNHTFYSAITVNYTVQSVVMGHLLVLISLLDMPGLQFILCLETRCITDRQGVPYPCPGLKVSCRCKCTCTCFQSLIALSCTKRLES